MEIHILGPIEAWHAGRQVTFARRQQRLILGILACDRDQLVLCDQLIDLIWGDRPPSGARAVVQSRISEIRAALMAAQAQSWDCTVETNGAGYVLRIPRAQVDAHRFRQLVEDARDTRDDNASRALYREALALWRGPAFGGWLSARGAAVCADPLEAVRLSAAEELFDRELALGHHHEIADEILEVFTANPARERLVWQLMTAQVGAGRPSAALRAYDGWRRWLADELGTDPGDHVQALYLAILRGDALVP